MKVLDIVQTLESMDICYFSHNREGLTNMRDTPLAGLYNVWTSVHGNGADLRVGLCEVEDKLKVCVYQTTDEIYNLPEGEDIIAIFPLDSMGVSDATEYMNTLGYRLSED